MFEGNTIIIQKTNTPTDPYTPFLTYLSSRDKWFPIHPELWLTSHGKVPTRHWFISHLHSFFPNNIAGQPLRSGGATSLAEAGADLDTIQATGHWESCCYSRDTSRVPRPSASRLDSYFLSSFLNLFFFSCSFHRFAHSFFIFSFLFFSISIAFIVCVLSRKMLF